MNTGTLNMTEGSPLKLLISFSVPMIIGNLFQQVYNLVDSVVVGRFVGSEALASVGATTSVTFLFFALCNGIANGGGILTSQQFGAGNDQRVRRVMVNSAYIMLTVSLSVALLAFLASSSVLRLMRTPENILHNAVIYMQMQCISLPFVAVYNYASAMLRALGNSRTPLLFLIFACILNGILDLVFVYSFQMGVYGAALATLIAQFLSGITCLGYAFCKNPYFRFRKEHLPPSSAILINIVKLGVPLSLQYSLIALSCMALQSVVNSFGAAAVAAFTAVSRIETLIHQPYGSLSTAISTYSGQNMGANRYDRIVIGFRKGLLLIGVFSLLMLPIVQLGSGYMVRVFVNDPEVIRLGTTALVITSWFYFSLGIIYVCRGVLNGVGDAAFAFINGLVEMVGRITLPVILTSISVIGIWGIWWSAAFIWVISAFFCLLRYHFWAREHHISLVPFSKATAV